MANNNQDTAAKDKAAKEAAGKADKEATEQAAKEASATQNFAEKAKELMQKQNVKEIWRCPKTGYWFTRKEYAKANECKEKTIADHYQLGNS
jgi:rubrerythrin